ncbi:MAG: class I SAM-dependent DNA methyltransferase [Sphingomicrobium sp.]
MTVDEFIAKWENCPGSERANYAVFLTELAGVLGVQAPGPRDDYRIDAPVAGGAEAGGTGFIDCYKRGCFILEAKQSKICELPQLPGLSSTPLEAPAKYDELMRRAFRQARRYAVNLPADHPWPPFILIVDVGRAFEIYFDFAGNGRDYRFFPDRSSYRVPIRALRDTKIQERLRGIWTNPKSLDPRLVTADVTRDVAKRLASVSSWLEETQRLKTGASAADWEHSMAIEETSLFLMRVLFCMFAEDARLLADDPDERPFKDFLRRTLDDDQSFSRGLADLWQKMGQANLADRWTFAFQHSVKYFNGSLFADTKTYELAKAERGELLAAAEYEWKNVEPAIFGTLLEQALTASQRSQLGAHYTPRPYVERIVEATITDVLRPEWEALETSIEGMPPVPALARLGDFHDQLASIRVLDPACGTGNFLYVAMEALLGLENKILQAIEDLGGTARSRVGPGQFHGLEKNPRAAKIAELVLWIGWLRWNIRNGAGEVQEPILGQRANINFGRPGGYDGVLAESAPGVPDFENPRQPDWPEADFIVGNPPYIGGKDIRSELGGDYAEALWEASPAVPGSADLVMHWWNRAANILTTSETRLRRFGFVTTNSITQVFSRRVVDGWVANDDEARRLHLVMACPDHPWTKVTRDAAAVRVAMTVAAAGADEGTLLEVEHEAALDTDTPEIRLAITQGRINSNLSIGPDPTQAQPLVSNETIASPGVKLHGNGFIVTAAEAEALGLGRREGLEQHIRPYRNGRDLLQRSRNVMVIDFFGLTENEIRQRFPEVYQHLLLRVWDYKAFNKKERKWELAGRKYNPRETYKKNWWIFGEPRAELRPALAGLGQYIATVETSKHRIFQFLDGAILPDNKLTVIASDDAFHLGVLSSRAHRSWYLANAGMIGVFNEKAVWVKAGCWDPFAFPDVLGARRTEIADLAKELDRTRYEALTEVGGLKMTDIYNWRERIAAGEQLKGNDLDRATAARAFIIHRLHEQIDAAVADAYGWPTDLAPAEIVARLVALNAERAAEEKAGKVRWLRPQYQVPRFGKT